MKGTKLPCPACGERTKVVDSRPNQGGKGVWRRVKCPNCGRRYTTQERIIFHPNAQEVGQQRENRDSPGNSP